MGKIGMSLVSHEVGGTSVEDPAAIGRTAAIVAGRVAMGKQPVVGCQRHGPGDRPICCAPLHALRKATAPALLPSVRVCARAIATPLVP